MPSLPKRLPPPASPSGGRIPPLATPNVRHQRYSGPYDLQPQQGPFYTPCGHTDGAGWVSGVAHDSTVIAMCAAIQLIRRQTGRQKTQKVRVSIMPAWAENARQFVLYRFPFSAETFQLGQWNPAEPLLAIASLPLPSCNCTCFMRPAGERM